MEETTRTVAVRRAIDVTGIVQGVGFRPFVYRLAHECNLTGLIANTPAGVTIEVQGEGDVIERFLARLQSEAPPLAKITSLSPRDIEVQTDTAFRIVSSRLDKPPKALISPDVAVCADCLREMMNPRDRRFRYPFINCTNCGPRFTIIRDIPYDRARTSMASFRMCAACQAEYDDPANRRFHAQPNACWDCGPQLQLWSADGSRVDTAEPIREAARLLELDAVVAVKGLGGFHLACNARSEVAVNTLRERKRRVEKPFAVMLRRIEDIERVCALDDHARKLLLSFERPILLLPRRPDANLAGSIAPHNRFLGVFLPYTPLHHLLFSSTKVDALIMTSANLSEEPIAIDNQEAAQRLQAIADAYLVHNRDVLRRCDDSVVRLAAGRSQQLRRSRGFVPVPVPIERESEPILAVGGELKNTICVVRGSEAFLSQHIGDLENLESYKFFEEAVEHLQRILEVHPKIIAYDLHPDYFSTKWALAQEGMQLVGVQHHHAHIAACMAENHLDGKVIGIALDGTGYGTDGAIWGGEVLLADYSDFERAAHFEYVPLPGGAAAIHEPWRMAVSYLARHYGKDLSGLDLPFLQSIDARRLHVVQQMIDREIHSPRTSSCGRLFDAVAALAGIRSTVNYEAQAAIEFEMAGHDSTHEGAYPFDLIPDGSHWQIGTLSLFQSLLGDIKRQESVADISRRFHRGLASVFVDLARKIREQSKLDRVCLSGGCFQNLLLFELLLNGLRAESFEVYFHSEVPPGDGGISLGQALVAAHRLQSNPLKP
ncbi:MAG TPA: carbamoyltransferase HypF [Candidatus Sulfotelmatobacter sp.]|nr:carbamoyltransferase HypF [Candidatus Sulfotelmatobacter sp.]